MKRLDGKVALITGAGAGIGRACMELFAQEGAIVVGASRTKGPLDEVMAGIEAAGGKGMVMATDVSKEDQVKRLVDAAIAKYGRIDVLVSAAGVGWSWGEKSPGSMNPTHTTPLDKWHEVIDINLTSVYLLARFVIPHMIEQKSGSIINIASVVGMRGLMDSHTYTATKGAILNLTRSMAVTYGRQGIRVNSVAPGFIATAMIAPALPAFEDINNPIVPAIPRPGRPMEIAYGCLYLASDESSYTSGSALVIDGGMTARI